MLNTTITPQARARIEQELGGLLPDRHSQDNFWTLNTPGTKQYIMTKEIPGLTAYPWVIQTFKTEADALHFKVQRNIPSEYVPTYYTRRGLT